MNFLDEDFNQTKSTEKNATNSFIPAKRSFKLQPFTKMATARKSFLKLCSCF